MHQLSSTATMIPFLESLFSILINCTNRADLDAILASNADLRATILYIRNNSNFLLKSKQCLLRFPDSMRKNNRTVTALREAFQLQ